MDNRYKWICFIIPTFLVPPIHLAQPVPYSAGPETVLEWSRVEYKYTNQEERRKDVESGNFIPGSPVIIDVDVDNLSDEKRSTYFVTTPRFKAGIPATLGKVTNEKIDGNNVIEPYPSWSWHRNPTKCLHDRLVSVFRIKIDSCGRLWVLDNGNYQDKLICPPQILAFDLRTLNISTIRKFVNEEDDKEFPSIVRPKKVVAFENFMLE